MYSLDCPRFPMDGLRNMLPASPPGASSAACHKRCIAAVTARTASITGSVPSSAHGIFRRPPEIDHFLDAKDMGTHDVNRTASATTSPRT